MCYETPPTTITSTTTSTTSTTTATTSTTTATASTAAAVSSIVRLYNTLSRAHSHSDGDLGPSPHINAAFSELVALCVQPYDRHQARLIVRDRRLAPITAHLRALCSTGEFLLESYWALRFLAAPAGEFSGKSIPLPPPPTCHAIPTDAHRFTATAAATTLSDRYAAGQTMSISSYYQTTTMLA